MFEHLLQELLARVLTVISSAFYPSAQERHYFHSISDFKILTALNSCHLCVGIDDFTKILAVSELQRVFLESLGHQKGSHGFEFRRRLAMCLYQQCVKTSQARC